jgi:hypothetical protein
MQLLIAGSLASHGKADQANRVVQMAISQP